MEQLQHSRNNDLAVAVSRHHANNCPLISRDKIFCFDRTQNIGSFSVFMLMRTNFEFNANINQIIRRAIEAGLLEKWHADSKITYKYHKGNDGVKPLSIEHVGVGWFVILIGSIWSFLFALIEKFIRKKTLAGGNCFWLLAEKVFDGDRHYFLNEY